MCSDQACFEDVTFADRNRTAVVAGQGQRYADALRPFYHVRVSHDVTVGIDDDSRADGLLANDESRLSSVLFVNGSVTSHKNLNNRGRDFGGETFESVVELDESSGGGGRFVRLGGLFFCGSFLLGKLGGGS